MSTPRISLSSLRIDKPCSQNWTAMSGNDRRRFCAQCQHHVHNFAELTEREIQKLLNSGERVCGRLERDSFGRVVTQSARGFHAGLSRTASAVKWALSSALACLVAVPSRADTPPPPKPPAQTMPEKSPAPPQPNSPPSTQTSPPSSPQLEDAETIELVAMGLLICEKPKPPIRKKYKK